MKFKVEYKRYFEEFGFEDYDTETFDNLSEAWNRFNQLKDTPNGAKLYARDENVSEYEAYCRIA